MSRATEDECDPDIPFLGCDPPDGCRHMGIERYVYGFSHAFMRLPEMWTLTRFLVTLSSCEFCVGVI